MKTFLYSTKLPIRVLMFLAFSCIAGTSHGQDTTTWVKAFNTANDIRVKTIASQKIGTYYYDSSLYASGIFWAEQGLPYAKRSNSDSLLWEQYDLLADLHDGALHFDTSINYMLLSLAIKKKNNNLRQIAGTYNDLGVVYGQKTALVQQADYYYKAKRIYDQIGDTVEGLSVAGNIASNYFRQRQFERSLKEYHSLMPLLKRQPSKSMLYHAYVRMALCFSNLGIKDSTFYYSNLEIITATKMGNESMSSDSWGRRAFFCSEFDNFKDFRQALDSMQYYAQRVNGDMSWADYYLSLGNYQTKVTKEYQLAIRSYYNAIAYTKRYSDKTAELDLLLPIAKAYSLANNPDSAYQIMLQAYALKDSIITGDGREKLAEMQTQYETEKKEAQIHILDKENKLKQRTTYFLIGGLGFLAVVLVSLFRNNQLKQKSNRKLQTLNHALDEANQSKVQLFSILSHDLRSPVSSLYSYLQLKKIAPQMLSDDKRQEKEEQLFQNAGHLLNTMEDILLWSKSQLENFVPNKTEVSVLSLIEEVLTIYQSAIVSKSINVVLPQDDMSIATDENMLQTILRNVLANAIQHTPEGGHIKISFEKMATAIAIFNSGKPIEPVLAKSIFDWSSINSRSSGYGLKLSKALADKLAISLAIDPQKDGNLFTIFQQ